ncbi:hypothetical protein [Actinoplanes sp. L3-i22]|uniref:hypothetical protein n=1 Tax=Actinoplanes sp. L3-i22 TaxID=2836373 RepID=UPI001C743CAC|nr:hypothetical protein [Actinoplanes sp. L3-i22]BCY10076.1 hypothetical protein L3i22_051640 [Actinoplanes sp. L3-i22]
MTNPSTDPATPDIAGEIFRMPVIGIPAPRTDAADRGTETMQRLRNPFAVPAEKATEPGA